MKIIFTAALSLFAAAPALAETRVSVATFVFARPGETTPDQARKLAGMPTEEYESEVLLGEIEPDVVRPNLERHLDLLDRGAKDRRPIERVLVLHWRDEVDPLMFGTLVFRKGTLAWAIVPVSASESTRTKLAQRFAETPKTKSELVEAGDVRWTRDALAYSSRGLAYFERPDGSIAYKMVYAPRTGR